MKVVISCGGTGGHITPGLAIADIVKNNAKRAEILFLGACGGMEVEMVTRAGYPIRTLPLRGLSRSVSPSNLKALLLARNAGREIERMFCECRPDIVIGTGGYVCYPALHAAVQMGIPTAVHESNAYPGLAVRRLSAEVGRIWLNFEEAALHLHKKARVLTVGNPLLGRPTDVGKETPKASEKMLLSFGGSLGAHEINRAAISLMEHLREYRNVFYLHATGKREYEEMHRIFCEKRLQECKHLQMLPFIEDMPQKMAMADLVICRAGAISISELAAAGRAAILIPSPNVTGNHQLKNALALQRKGAAVCLREEELRSDALWQQVRLLLGDERRRSALSVAIRGFYTPDANARIWADICALCREK